mgnify:FL=1
MLFKNSSRTKQSLVIAIAAKDAENVSPGERPEGQKSCAEYHFQDYWFFILQKFKYIC